MKVKFKTSGIDLSASRRDRLARRIKTILCRFVDRAETVSVDVTQDLPDADTGHKCCQVTIKMPRLRVMARHRASSVVGAVSLAVGKAVRSLERYARKRRKLGVPIGAAGSVRSVA